MTIWSSLARIRDISRLVLAAIEHEDLDQIERLSREGKALLAVVQPVLERMRQDSTLPDDIGPQIRDLGTAYQSIVRGLEFRRDEIGRQLEDLRRTRSRLRSAGLQGQAAPQRVDRRT